MAGSADTAGGQDLARVIHFSEGQVIQELGYDDDVDQDLREALEDLIDSELEDEDCQEIVDGVVMWWRDGDGDLVDSLVDALATLAPGASIWLFTPKAGRPEAVDQHDIAESADLAGLRASRPVTLAPDWSGTHLVSPRGGR